jgi:CRISPR-associated protein Csd1
MIIQSLVALYERLAGSDDPLPAPGWKENEIAFVIDLDRDGNPTNMLPLRTPQQKGRARAPLRLVPQEVKRPGKTPEAATDANCWQASLFWDSPPWALGLPKSDDGKARQEAEVRHGQFKLRHAKFAREAGADVAADPGMRALLRFLDRGAANELPAEQAAEIQASGGNVAFRLDGDPELICRRAPIRAAISAAALTESDDATGQCLVTGRLAPIARLHPSIQGVAGAQSSGANMVSFNLPAFGSYGLDQGENAPVSEYAAFAYTTALNFLLRHGSPFHARAGATTVVFWAGKQTPNEEVACSLLAAVAEDDPWQSTALVERLEKSPVIGVRPELDDDTAFYILGLSAESRSRLTVRFFHAGTIGEAGRLVKRWFDQLRIVPEGGRPLSMVALRRAIAVQGDLKNAPPLLEAELLRAAYTGAPLPQRVLGEVLARCSAEGVTRERAALIKAFLMRNERRNSTVSLDPDEPDPAYRLGRLFAVLERVQQAATDAKAGIGERYWGAASTTPAYTFPELLKLATFHLAKLDNGIGWQPGFAANRREEIKAIIGGLPPHLPHRLELVEQGSFAIGYWHQIALRRAGGGASTINDGPEELAA